MNSQNLIFVDIDTQYDFIMPDGNLYVPGAEQIIPNLKKLTEFAVNNNIPVFASADSHDENDPEFADFPPHCVRDTDGNRKLPETQLPQAHVYSFRNPQRPAGNEQYCIFTKQQLNVFSNPVFESCLKTVQPQRVVLYGVATEFCVYNAGKGLLERGYPVTLVTDAIRAVSEEKGAETLEYFKTQGVIFRKTADIISFKF